MGSTSSKIFSFFSKHEEMRIIMLGLDAAGKTTILYMMKLGEVVTTIPTIGFNVETVTYRNIHFTTWDVGGRDKIRTLWRHYYQNVSALIFVVDSNDRDRLAEAREELHKMANEEGLKHKPILIFANKQDLPNKLTLDELKEGLDLVKFDETKTKWHLQPSSATKHEGFDEGLKWLADTIKPTDDLTSPIQETVDDTKIMKKDLVDIWKSIDVKNLLSKFI